MSNNICKKCGQKYKRYMLSNYNLDLCLECNKLAEQNEMIEREEFVTKKGVVCSHCQKNIKLKTIGFKGVDVDTKVKCPKCNFEQEYKVDSPCEKNCGVWFFWDDLDNHVFARWVSDNFFKK